MSLGCPIPAMFSKALCSIRNGIPEVALQITNKEDLSYLGRSFFIQACELIRGVQFYPSMLASASSHSAGGLRSPRVFPMVSFNGPLGYHGALVERHFRRRCQFHCRFCTNTMKLEKRQTVFKESSSSFLLLSKTVRALAAQSTFNLSPLLRITPVIHYVFPSSTFHCLAILQNPKPNAWPHIGLHFSLVPSKN